MQNQEKNSISLSLSLPLSQTSLCHESRRLQHTVQVLLCLLSHCMRIHCHLRDVGQGRGQELSKVATELASQLDGEKDKSHGAITKTYLPPYQDPTRTGIVGYSTSKRCIAFDQSNSTKPWPSSVVKKTSEVPQGLFGQTSSFGPTFFGLSIPGATEVLLHQSDVFLHRDERLFS